MKIDVLFFQGCPNHEPTVLRIRDLTAQLDIDADIHEVDVTSTDEAIQRRFLGSPTVQIDGVDIEPAARSRVDFGMACRMYAGSGVPSEALIAVALIEAGGPRFRKSASGKIASWTTGISLLAALAASACCWLPLALIAFGISGSAMSATFQAWRPVLVPVSFLLLSAAFYVTYRKPKARREASDRWEGGNPSCAIDTPNAVDRRCCPPQGSARPNRMNRFALWIAMAFVIALAFFPNYSAFLTSEGVTPVAVEGFDTLAVKIEGMTCSGCADAVRGRLALVPGVHSVDVSLAEGEAKLRTLPRASESIRTLIEAEVRSLGFRAVVDGPEIASNPHERMFSRRSALGNTVHKRLSPSTR